MADYADTLERWATEEPAPKQEQVERVCRAGIFYKARLKYTLLTNQIKHHPAAEIVHVLGLHIGLVWARKGTRCLTRKLPNGYWRVFFGVGKDVLDFTEPAAKHFLETERVGGRPVVDNERGLRLENLLNWKLHRGARL